MHPDALSTLLDESKLAARKAQLNLMATQLTKSMTLASMDTCPCGCGVSRASFQPAHRLPAADLLTPQLLTDLRGTVKVLRTYGWIRGSWHSTAGHCGLGATQVFLAGHRNPLPFDFQLGGRLEPRFSAVAQAFTTWLGVDMPRYNDFVARSADEVIGEIEALIREVECYLSKQNGRPGPVYTLEELEWDSKQPANVTVAPWAQLEAMSKVTFEITPEAIASIFDVPADMLTMKTPELVPA